MAKWGDYFNKIKQYSFVGRDKEKELFKKFITKQKTTEKILYIWGPGGTGKSTLLDEFARIANNEMLLFIKIDSRDFPHTPQGFMSKLVSFIHQETDYKDLQSCIKSLEEASTNQKIILAIDTFEEMNDMDDWIREEFFPELTDTFLVVLAGRVPLTGAWNQPLWQRVVRSIRLSFFDLETTRNYLQLYEEQNEAVIHRLFTLSKGHPLTISLLIGRSGENLLDGPDAEMDRVLKQVAESWFREVSDPFLKEMVEAASMVRFFNQESLEHMLQTKITLDAFEQLKNLSFIRESRRGWFVHDLLRPIMIRDFKQRRPQVFRVLWDRAVDYLQQSLASSTSETDHALLTLDLVFMVEDYTLRSIFLTETPESGYYYAQLPKEQVAKAHDYIEKVLRSRLDVYQEFFDPQTNQRYENSMPFSYIERAYQILDLNTIVQLDEETIFMIKNEQHVPISLIVVIPIHRGTLPFLKNSPISRSFFEKLTSAEIRALEKDRLHPAGWFFYHIDQWLDHSAPARTALFHFMINRLMRQGIFVHSSPLKLHQDVVTNLGFQEVLGTEHHDYGDELLSKTYCLDLRGDKNKAFLHRLIESVEIPPNTHTQLSVAILTPRENEIVEWVLKGLTNIEIAKELFLSEITIKKHLSSIYEKLKVKGKAQLVQRIMSEQKERQS
jgi:DNA-binding CsgD family transcriptional regulator/energy-coupling factor transporter ATP-binding protein EcfA2